MRCRRACSLLRRHAQHDSQAVNTSITERLRYYIGEGTWDLLRIDPLVPDMRVREEGRIRMVGGDLTHRPLGYEPTTISAFNNLQDAGG